MLLLLGSRRYLASQVWIQEFSRGGCKQWCNGQGWQSAPPQETSDREIFADLPGKKRQGKNGKGGKMEKKRRKIVKGKVEIENEERTFFFCFVLFCFVCLFFFFAFHFSKRRKFVLGVPKWKFSTGKKHFTPGKKSGKMTLPLQKNFPVTPLGANTLFKK